MEHRSDLACITTPSQGNRLPAGVQFVADNGCFGKGYPGDSEWLTWLDSLDRGACSFAVAPDVVGDARATLARSTPFLPRIREFGFRAALVAQNGLEDLDIPWDAFDVLFVGGDTAWKIGPAALTRGPCGVALRPRRSRCRTPPTNSGARSARECGRFTPPD